MPPGVLGFEAVDDVEKEDYENVLLPAVEAAIAKDGKVRLLYVLGHEFDDYEGERSGRTSSSAPATRRLSSGSRS